MLLLEAVSSSWWARGSLHQLLRQVRLVTKIKRVAKACRTLPVLMVSGSPYIQLLLFKAAAPVAATAIVPNGCSST
jgi:hypothetical protein